MQQQATTPQRPDVSGTATQGFETPVSAPPGPDDRRSPFTQISLQWLLVSACVVVATTLFVSHEHSRTIEQTHAQLDLTARFLAAELSEVDAASAPALLGFLVQQVPQGFDIYLTGDDGRLIAATGEAEAGGEFSPQQVLSNRFSASAPLGNLAGKVITAIRQEVALAPVWRDATLAGGLAVFVMMLAWRRRQTQAPQTVLNLPDSWPKEAMEALPFGMAQWSAAGELITCNQLYRDYLALDAADTKVGSAYVKTMKKVTGDNGCLLLSEAPACRLSEITRPDDTVFLLDERPLQTEGFVTLVCDISEQKQAQAALDHAREEQRVLTQQLREETFKAEAASRAKTSFLAHLSHDVRTPLNHIIGFADLIVHQTYGPVGDKRYINYINDIKNSGEKLLTSFSEILELAQLEGGHLILRRETFNVAELIKSTASRFQSHAERAGLTLIIDPPEDTDLYADRLCTERMLGNIIENAIQFTPSGGRIKLAAWVAEDGVVLEVSDSGIGISEDRLKDLSQPFVLGDAAFTREGNGVGLGIAISRAIAELSGGELAIDSSPAVGTTVAISLPLRVRKASRAAQAA